MGTWNYRALEKIVGGTKEIGIYAVYYDDEGRPTAASMEPERVMDYSIEGLEQRLELMQECLEKPLLIWEEIGQGE